jgi:casein kinase 1
MFSDGLVGGKFRVRRRIGSGSFGEIYSGEDIHNHRRVALKFESIRSRVPQLSYESKLYAALSGGTGVPNLHWFGASDTRNVMVIDLLGKSLEALFVSCHHRFSLKTVLMLADQMISCIEFIHNKGFIHRDIKPDNFVMGLSPASNQVFIIDFGLAKKYRDSHTRVHIPYAQGKSFTGTARYASLAALRGIEQSRRDDLESLGYVWLYFLRGSLPWMGITGRDRREKYEAICDAKAQTSFEDLCRGFPRQFIQYFHAVRDLRFADKPDYAALKRLFREAFVREGYVYDYKYDWVRRPQPVRRISLVGPAEARPAVTDEEPPPATPWRTKIALPPTSAFPNWATSPGRPTPVTA